MGILKFKKAVTLLELVVVITIIGILATTVIASYDTVRKKSRDTRRKEDLNALKSALVLYYQDKNEYPPSCSPCADEYLSSGTSDNWINSDFLVYMAGSTMPKDPIQTPGDCTSANTYCYFVLGDRKSFILFTNLENANDPELNTNPNALCQILPSTGTFNYCVKSPVL